MLLNADNQCLQCTQLGLLVVSMRRGAEARHIVCKLRDLVAVVRVEVHCNGDGDLKADLLAEPAQQIRLAGTDSLNAHRAVQIEPHAVDTLDGNAVHDAARKLQIVRLCHRTARKRVRVQRRHDLDLLFLQQLCDLELCKHVRPVCKVKIRLARQNRREGIALALQRTDCNSHVHTSFMPRSA